MIKELKEGLIVAGIAVIAFLLYKNYNKKQDIVVSNNTAPTIPPVEVQLPVEPVEKVLINAPLSM
jgi:uncharacterized membrane protein YebE (DUF533 family)